VHHLLSHESRLLSKAKCPAVYEAIIWSCVGLGGGGWCCGSSLALVAPRGRRICCLLLGPGLAICYGALGCSSYCTLGFGGATSPFEKNPLDLIRWRALIPLLRTPRCVGLWGPGAAAVYQPLRSRSGVAALAVIGNSPPESPWHMSTS
jgi:hypothetical protein